MKKNIKKPAGKVNRPMQSVASNAPRQGGTPVKPAKKSSLFGTKPAAKKPLPNSKPVSGGAEGAVKKTKKNSLFDAKKPKKKLIGNAQPAASTQPSENVMKKPVAPISGTQKKAYDKAVKNRTATKKKRGSRGGNYALYYIFAGIIAVIVFAILAKTVLFNCSSIEVEGNQRYSADEIISASGLVTGRSLLDIDENAAKERIISSLAYIDMAEVTKSFPTKMKISVKEAEKWYNLQHGGSYFIVSRLGKVIEAAKDSSLPVIKGYEPDEPSVGVYLTSQVDGKTDIPAQVLTAAETAGLTGITSMDITDRFEIKVLVDDRITLELGNATQLENKMYIAKELIATEITATESVTVNLTNTEKVYVRDNNVIDNPSVVVPVLPESEPEDDLEAPAE